MPASLDHQERVAANLQRAIVEIADTARAIRTNNYTRGVSIYMRVEWVLALDAHLHTTPDNKAVEPAPPDDVLGITKHGW